MAADDKLFEPSRYAAVRQPLELASTLPSACYTSGEFFERERHRIFRSAWHFAGRVDELSNAGNCRVVDTPSGSTIVTRTSNGELRAFFNACRHRGARLLNESTTCRHLVCPYHSWTYDLDGQLRGAPGMQGVSGFDRSDFGLEPVRLETWGGFIFVQHDARAGSLLETLGDLAPRMSPHGTEAMRTVYRKDFSINANWKFLVENAVEAYHTGTVHSETLGHQDSESVTTRGDWMALYVPSEPAKSLGTLPGAQQAMPFIEGLSGPAASGTFFTVVYPSTQIVFAQDCAWWLNFVPQTADRTRLEFGACFPAASAAMPDFSQRLAPYIDRWETATPEDNAIAEAQQYGHESGVSLSGRYALTERCVHQFDNWVLDQML